MGTVWRHTSQPFRAYYAATINKVLDEMYAPCATAKDAAKPHALPAVPLDAYSYTNGRLVDIRQAHIGKVGSWLLHGLPGLLPKRVGLCRRTYA